MTYFMTNYLQALISWALNMNPKSNYAFIIERLGPTMLGVKPAELLNVAIGNPQSWDEFKTLFTLHGELQLEEIRRINGRQQVIFYHRTSLDDVLSKTQNLEFLQSIDYPTSYSMDGYLQHVLQKIQSRVFPHEIGIFLGYPLKDVMGFMGHCSLPYVRTEGWRVYGDEKCSNATHEKYQQARVAIEETLLRDRKNP